MSETLLPDDELNRLAAALGNPRPSMGEGLGAALETGFQSTTLGSVATLGREVAGERRDPTPLTREEWQASGLARDRLTYEEGMTRGRAEAMARTFDAQQARNRVMQARDPNALETALQFGAQVAGNIPDPANLLPFVGAARLGLGAARSATAGAALLTESTALAGVSGTLGRAGAALGGAGIGAGVARGVVDATLGNLAVAPLVYSVQERYGEDVTFGTVLRDLSIGALIGAGFGAAAGALGRGSDPRTAVRVLDTVAGDIAAGRTAEVPMPLVRASVEDAVMRSAPVDMAGVRLADLPVGPDGGPVSRAEFEAAMGQSGRMEPPAAPTERLAPLLEGNERTWDDIARDRGDGLASPWLTESGRFLDTGGDHISLASRMDEAGMPSPETYSDIAKNAGALSMQFGPGRDGFSVYVRIGEDQRITPQQMQAIDRLMQQPGAKLGVSEVSGNQITSNFRDAEARALLEGRVDQPDTSAGAEAYGWYREALAARQHMDRMAAAPAARETGNPVPEQNQRVTQEPAADAPDPELDAALQQIEALRNEGRISPGDEAILRAGAEQADELNAVADGLEEAGACLLRNLT